jgi:hypothetical protein
MGLSSRVGRVPVAFEDAVSLGWRGAGGVWACTFFGMEGWLEKVGLDRAGVVWYNMSRDDI